MDTLWSHIGLRVALTGDVDALVDALLPDGTTCTHHFEPHGYSVVRLGTEATIAVHTWPERGIATVDGYGAASSDLAARVAALGWAVLE
ncbi:MAG: S-adenosylmethionine decarboxylase [Alphaproteobacteria bacterium]|nr:S-adenosylmethionine decarboxylase [Alphaproteobacteria bacterium]